MDKFHIKGVCDLDIYFNIFTLVKKIMSWTCNSDGGNKEVCTEFL
jgi:hypothetical protein